jgi:hypothetical protein
LLALFSLVFYNIIQEKSELKGKLNKLEKQKKKYTNNEYKKSKNKLTKEYESNMTLEEILRKFLVNQNPDMVLQGMNYAMKHQRELTKDDIELSNKLEVLKKL